jgi:sigma-B regulation protein RsbU (phosphoserine phosphatase)
MDTAESEVPRWARLDSSLVREMQAAIIVTDLDGVIRSCNPYAQVLYGRPASELIGHDSAAFAASPVSADLAREIYRALRAGRTWEGEFSVRRKDGSVVVVHVIDSPLHDDEDRLAGVASMSLDVTARRRAEARLRVQYELARTLSEAHSLAEATPRLLRTVGEALGWDVGTIWGLDIERSVLRCIATWRSPESDAAVFEELTSRTTFRKGVGLPGRVWSEGRSAWIADVVHDLNFPRARVAAADGLHGGFAVPIRRGRDVLGVVEFFAPEIREPDDDLLEMMDAVGAQLGQFIDRTETERALRVSRAGLAQLAQTLQRSLLPPHLPSIPGVEIAAHYEAARDGSDVGGDFYDVFESARNDWSIVIGDVCGKGPEAAALTALVRYTIRAAAIQTRRPHLVLNLVNEAVLRQADEQFCTVAYVRLRPEGDGARLTISCAGHPLPFLLRTDGKVESVATPGRVLGLFAELASVDRIVRLDPGETLLLYTDGVTDARGPEGFLGEERLRETLTACAGSSADDTVKAIEHSLREFHGGRPRDDIAFVVLRVPG